MVAVALAMTACTVGPDYLRPSAPTPARFKEFRALKGWKIATPRDDFDRGAWWTIYKDSRLDSLAPQVEISNQNVAAAAAAYEQARALIREAQASLFPVITGSYNATRQHSAALTTTTYTPETSATWDLDVWGRIRRQVESATAGAQASASDLANAKLSAQAQLASAYFNMRAADSLKDLLDRTIAEYKRTVEITQNQYNAGTVSQADLITAQNQLLNTQAQAINVGIQRAQFEHAIAILLGKPPADFSLPRLLLTGSIPKIPVALPSALLERRPDIAAAERVMQQQNALIGVAIAGYFPDISLSAAFGYAGHVPLPFNVANEIWSLGATGTEVLFSGGLRGAQVDAARATYWQSVATYRQTVLTAFQQVEDQLAGIRILTRQLGVQEEAVKKARQAVDVYLNQYKAGTIPFTTVVVAQATLLSQEEAALTSRQTLFVDSVVLIEALGGGWDVSLLPTPAELSEGISLLPQL